jgi:hypothetical protein
MPAQAREILQIDFKNPQFDRTDDWAKAIVGERYPITDYEWTQVLAPKEEYDLELVGAAGWMINPHHSGGDIPFTHPFLDSSGPRPSNLLPIFDWEFHLALDTEYQFLLAEGNRLAGLGKEKDRVAEAIALLKNDEQPNFELPKGLLGVEIDGGFVPVGFKNGAASGDRVAVFGRWIVDGGHRIPEPLGSFRSEIHPPLLMARASVQENRTRVLFTSRPYLVGQRFTLDTDKIYDDSAGDDGPALAHFAKEFAKISTPVPLSFLVQAHPKIKSYPFRGVHLVHIKVRPPRPQGRPIHGTRPRLHVSFQFTARSGCAVQVSSSSPDTVDVLISLSDAGYTPPPLPHRNEHNWKRDEVFAMGKEYGWAFEALESGSPLLASFLGIVPGINAAIARGILERGIRSDVYDPLPGVDINDAQHAVTRTPPEEVPAGAGIVQSNNQPFPIFGWLEASWELVVSPVPPII